MPTPRRTIASALIIGASAVALTGCLPLPPALPSAPPAPTVGTSADPSTAPDPAESPESSSPAEPAETATAPADGDFPYTVDDQAGDVWSFDVTNLIADPPLESGSPEDGTFFVGVVISADHVEGGASFRTCFDIFIKGTDGETYDWSDSIGVLAENDVRDADGSGFTDAVAAVQLPEGVEPDQVIIRASYGYPEVADTVIDVN